MGIDKPCGIGLLFDLRRLHYHIKGADEETETWCATSVVSSVFEDSQPAQ